jgi:hypothetical protein
MGTETEQIDSQLEQVTQAVAALKNYGREADRLAALRAARNLVTALQKPQDAVYNLAYLVIPS